MRRTVPLARHARLEDMRLFAKVAELSSFTAAARALGIPKQTLSRRIAELERDLGVTLLHRTTRRLKPTDAGAAYAERCAEIVRLAEEATRAVADAPEEPRGVLRVTADPVFGEAFVTELVVEYAKAHRSVEVEVVLTRRRVDLIAEGFDVAFRVGSAGDPSLSATSLGPARVVYCASPSYVRRRGAPKTYEELREHEHIVLAEGEAVRWPFRDRAGALALVPISGRLRVSSFAMAHAAARAGLGIAIFPEFACADDLERRRLVRVLEPEDVGHVWIVHPKARFLAARVRAFVELAVARFSKRPPWVLGSRR